jgi:hypothetical protein
MSSSLIVTIERVASMSQRQPRPHGCPQVLAALSLGATKKGLAEVATADVGSMRIDAGRGFLLYHGAHDIDYAMPIVLEGGEWKVTSLEGTPLL